MQIPDRNQRVSVTTIRSAAVHRTLPSATTGLACAVRAVTFSRFAFVPRLEPQLRTK